MSELDERILSFLIDVCDQKNIPDQTDVNDLMSLFSLYSCSVCPYNPINTECPVCHGTGWNHGAQCNPSKAHPTGWKTVKCDCDAGKSI